MFVKEFLKKATNIHFSIIDDCNLKCAYCFEHGFFKKKANTFENFLKTLDIFPYVKSIWLWGGEPTMKMDLVKEILEYVEKRRPDLNILMSTNGTNPEIVKYFNDYDCFKGLQISIDGVKECHDLMRNNSWDLAMETWNEAMNVAKRKRKKVMVNPVIHRKTLKYFIENMKFYQSILGSIYAPVMDSINVEELEEWWFSLSKSDKDFIRRNLISFRRGFKICAAGQSVQFIDTDGKIWFCHGAKFTRKRENMKFWIGNLENGIISWKPFFKSKRNPICDRCKVKYCRVCWFQGDCRLFLRFHELMFNEKPLDNPKIDKFDLWKMNLDEKMEHYYEV